MACSPKPVNSTAPSLRSPVGRLIRRLYGDASPNRRLLCIIGRMGRRSALARWLRGLDAPEIGDILALREDAADRRPDSLRALADELTGSASVRAAVDGLDQGCRDVLDTVVRLGDEAGVEALAERLRCNGKAS